MSAQGEDARRVFPRCSKEKEDLTVFSSPKDQPEDNLSSTSSPGYGPGLDSVSALWKLVGDNYAREAKEAKEKRTAGYNGPFRHTEPRLIKPEPLVIAETTVGCVAPQAIMPRPTHLIDPCSWAVDRPVCGAIPLRKRVPETFQLFDNYRGSMKTRRKAKDKKVKSAAPKSKPKSSLGRPKADDKAKEATKRAGISRHH